MTKQQAIFNWSGGKDSALSLYKTLQSNEYEVNCLLTSINEQYRRISMHGVREELLIQQAESLGISLVKMFLPEMPTMEVYENVMKSTLLDLQSKGATASIFGDIFLEDLRQYRENKLAELNLKGVFPLWKTPTKDIIKEFLDLGFKTITTCVNDKYLDKSFVGRIIDESFLNDLPENVDPCGENGEFHTFVFDGPIFKEAIPFEKGEIVYRQYTPTSKKDGNNYDCDDSSQENPFDNGFWYCDLLPK
ncbi:diphthine--ammonia ligase [Arcicella sp. DC2W]|uniref:Diphthine--ammonia ligase n=1 Tax=Arcicella gelida TaxID=2984195 RepID=A0ABU5SB42_9BACT|nr:diphthine--ammonia ligase [Arcicella sp. DC2W]MEA5405676.1 diphthine--ammonia ligase [Arcicella sp. DC2W]